MIAVSGWPGYRLAGEAGAAAWRIVQRAIGEPALQRAALPLLRAAAEAGDAAGCWAARLADRICVFEGRWPIYGTQFDWNDTGEINVYPPVAAPETVDARRALVGLGPLADQLRELQAAMHGTQPPADLSARRHEMETWASTVGWRPRGATEYTG